MMQTLKWSLGFSLVMGVVFYDATVFKALGDVLGVIGRI